MAGLFHAQVLNTAALSRDAGVARMTVEGFLGILEDTLLAFRLPAYEGRLRVREKRHPKLYWVDPGLARADASRTEVDFLLRKGGRFVALEVKSSRRLSADDFRGLRAVTALKGLSRRILVAPVADSRTTEDGIDVWTLDALRGPEALRAALA